MSVRLKSQRSRDINAVMDDVRGRVEAKYPAAQVDFHQVLQDNIGDIAGSPSPVQIKIFGPDEAKLESLAQQIDAVLAKTPGVVDDFNGIIHSSPEAVLTVDTQSAQRYGLTADDVTQAGADGLAGHGADKGTGWRAVGRGACQAGRGQSAADGQSSAADFDRLACDRHGRSGQRSGSGADPAR